MNAFISGFTDLVDAASALIIAVFILRNGGLLISSMTKMVQAIALIAVARQRERDSGLERLVAAVDRLGTGEQAPTLPAQRDGYDATYFARKHSLSKDQAERIIRRVGNDRERLNRAAERTKKKRQS